MGLLGICEYRKEKGSAVADFGLRCVFHLLYSLDPIVPRPRLGRANISARRLELVCDEGSCHVYRPRPEGGYLLARQSGY